MRVRWRAPILKDVLAMRAVMARKDEDASKRAVKWVKEIATLLATMPASARRGLENRKQLLAIPGAPYILVYRIQDKTVDMMKLYYSTDRRRSLERFWDIPW